MHFDLLVVLSPLLEEDSAHGADWTKHDTGTWSWCGVRTDQGGMPDSRLVLVVVFVCPLLLLS